MFRDSNSYEEISGNFLTKQSTLEIHNKDFKTINYLSSLFLLL